MGNQETETYDVAIVGGGILGITLSLWLSSLYETEGIVVVDKENTAGSHTSSRNTGVIHRPFYLDPEKKKMFARSAQISYILWKNYANARKLPWVEVGTVEVALNESDLKILEKYKKWSLENGVRDEEVELLDRQGVKELEPNIRCAGALFCKTDVATDFGLLTKSLQRDTQDSGIKYHLNTEVQRILVADNKLYLICKDGKKISTKFLINCSGGNAVRIAHLMGVAQEFTDLNFRGEYWVIDPVISDSVKHNIYSVPRYKDYPFLDPHWIVRCNGQVEIGPAAVPVIGPYTYRGFFNSPQQLFKKLFESPRRNKIKLLLNCEFWRLALEEWKSAFSKKVMVGRVNKFIPKLRAGHLIKPGSAGIRSSVIDKDGRFVKEALEFFGPHSFHILNFNSPGATGAPAYTAYIVDTLVKNNKLDHLRRRNKASDSLWSYEEVVSSFHRKK